MVDRQDIDALLIGSLYGELSSADEARLQAHLESHPGDRTALTNLTRARDTVRASRILQVQLEPPQSVSALLVQEAARRAPRASDEGGWFVRFVRSFATHPAMAAAAMLVVVVGVAGTLYMRQGDHFAEPVTASTPAGAPLESATSNRGGAAAGDDETVTLRNEELAAASQSASDTATAAATAPAADKDPRSRGPADTYGLRGNTAEGSAQSSYRVGLEVAPPPKPGVEATSQFERKSAPDSQLKKKAGPGGVRNGLEVRTPSAMPMELEASKSAAALPSRSDNAAAASDGDREAARAADTSDAFAGRAGQDETTRSAPRSAPPAVDAPTAAAPAPRSNTSAGLAEDSKDRNVIAPPRSPNDASGGRGDPGSNLRDQSAGSRNAAKAPDPELAWAKTVHQDVVVQVRNGNCRDAAALAVKLSSRAPGYYQENVANDRALKECAASIETARNQQTELRNREASKRATGTNAGKQPPATNQSPPPTNKPSKAAPVAK